MGSNFSTVSRLEIPSKPPQTNSWSPTATAPTALKPSSKSTTLKSAFCIRRRGGEDEKLCISDQSDKRSRLGLDVDLRESSGRGLDLK